MATVDGALLDPFVETWSVFKAGGADASAGLDSDLTNDVTVIDVESRTQNGAISNLFGGDWFGRLHALPSPKKWGTVRQTKDADIVLHNAGDSAQDLEGITGENDDGLSLTGASLPETIAGQQSITLTLSVTLSGPEKIDARYTLEGSEENALLLVVGERLVSRIFQIPPDWSQPVRERWKWRTDIQRSKSGKEARRAIYASPRRGMEWRIFTRSVSLLDRLLSGWQARLWLVPRWMDYSPLLSAASAGDAVIDVDTSVGEWREGEQVVLLNGEKTEAPVVAAVNAASLELDTSLNEDWPKGSAVYPARLMRLNTSLDVQRPTAGTVETTVQFIADEDTDTPINASDSETTFDSVPVRLKEPNRASADGGGYNRDVNRLDSQVGLILVDDLNGDPIHRHEWLYTLSSRSEVDNLIAWLLAREGRANAFRFPTWASDLQVTRKIEADDDTLEVSRIDWDRWFNGQHNRDAVAIETNDGSWFFARVTGATTSGDVETLQLDRELFSSGDTVSPSQIRRAMWLERVRLDSDRIEILWQTSDVAQVELPIVGVES